LFLGFTMVSCCRLCACCQGQTDKAGDYYGIVFLVNSLSGGRKGKAVLERLKQDYPAWDLREFSENEDLYKKFGSDILNQNGVVVCFAGGDGTGCWALKTIDRAILTTLGRHQDEPSLAPAGGCIKPSVPITRQTSRENRTVKHGSLPTRHRGKSVCADSNASKQAPYLAVIEEDDRICKEYYESGKIKFCCIPLGTGNDLSRCLGWSNKYCGNRKLGAHIQLMTLKERQLTWLDRWRVVFQSEDGEIREWRSNFMLNYLSVGYTADIAYHFDRARQNNKRLYKNILMNKLKYTLLGVEKALFNNPNITQNIELYVDGKLVQLREINTLCFHNIRSMSDGVDFWRMSRNGDMEWKEGQMGDRMIEVTSSNHVISYVKARLHLTGYTKVAQGSEICLVLKRAMAVQLDGESWIEEPGTIRLSHASSIQVPIGPKTPRGLSNV